MTENTNAAAATPSEPAKSTEAELKAMYNSLPEVIQQTIDKLNGGIAEHNKMIDLIQRADQKNPTLIKAEIFEQNPSRNRRVAKILEEYNKTMESAEKLRQQAYGIIESEGLMPKELTEAEISKAKDDVTTSNKSLKDGVTALAKMEEMMPILKGKILPLIDEIKTRRGMGIRATSGTSGDGPKTKRLRFKRIEINGVTSDDRGNTVYGLKDGEEKYTFTFASQYLRKQHKGINWTANDMTDAYLKGLDENNLPEVHEFAMPFTYKDDNGNEHTVNYPVKCFRA